MIFEFVSFRTYFRYFMVAHNIFVLKEILKDGKNEIWKYKTCSVLYALSFYIYHLSFSEAHFISNVS